MVRRQRTLLSPLRRLVRGLRGLRSQLPRSQRVYAVSLNGRRYKRVVLPDSASAARLAEGLLAFGPSGVYPALVAERENELLVEWIDGEALGVLDASALDSLADLFATLYTREPELVPADRAPFAFALGTDLRFLADVGVLASEQLHALEAFARRSAPEKLWVGYDCTDAVAKNFVREASGRVRAIDVESLRGGQLLGTGFAKARHRWLGARSEALLDILRARGAAPFEAYLPFVELCFLAFWQKTCFLEGKRRYLDRALFERFVEA